MSQLYQQQLQPFEENQSPSPVHEVADPFTSLSLARSRSSRLSTNAPSSPVNTLHRQLSGDPDAPPPAWKRRASFTQKPGQPAQAGPEPSTSPTRSAHSPNAELSPRPNLPPPVSRRHPQLQMTTSARPMFTHDSPNASSTSLYDPELAPPQPAFLRSKGGSRSNRSSIHSTDTSGMTSEDLWNMEVEPIADLSNPQRSAMERPLDTVRRLSQRSERRPVSVSPHISAMPVDFMWPTAPPDEEPLIRRKSKSTTNVPSLGGRQVRLGRKKGSRQASADPQMMAKVMDDPSSPNMPRSNSVFISGSAHSSTTDLSKGLPTNRSQASLATRPPSTYYSRDFLSQLAPREGGYAVAAMIASPAIPPQTAPGVVTAEEKRRSANLDMHRGSRPPTSRSAGMGRWSLDGGEHYGRPYATSSANTTQSNLSSAPPINSPQSSPPADEHSSLAPSLPDGASPPFTAASTTPPETSTFPGTTSAPIVPSPLSRAVTGTSIPPTPDAAADPLPAAIIPVAPIAAPAEPSRPALTTKQSKKQLAKDAKAAEKAEAAKVVAQRAAKAKEDAAKRQAEKDRAKEAKEAAKRKEKEEKERKKAEKRSLSRGTGGGLGEKLKSPSQLGLGLLRRNSEVPPVPSSSSGVPFPAANGLERRAPVAASAVPVAGQRRNQSMPIGAIPPTQSGSAESKKPKLGLFGTLRKRFSTMDTSSRSTLASSSAPGRTPITLDAPPAGTDTGSSVLPTPASTLVQSESTGETMPRHDTADVRAPTPPAKAPSIVLPPPAPAEDLPPRTTSIHQSPSRPIPASPPRTQAEDVPPRSTSIHPSPAREMSRSPSRTPQPSSSSDSHSPPSASTLRARNSLQGPRPMPRSGSVTSRTSRTTPVLAPVAMLDTSSGETALSQTQSHLTSSSGTYVESQMPMTPDDYSGGMDRGERGQMGGKEVGIVPEREDSGDTVRVEYGRQVAAH